MNYIFVYLKVGRSIPASIGIKHRLDSSVLTGDRSDGRERKE